VFGKKGMEKEQQKYEKNAWEFIDNQQKTDSLLKQALSKAEMKKGSLGELWDNLQLLIDLVKAYSKGEYRKVSKSTIITIIGALIYFIAPLDTIPDFIVGLGLIDDAAVIGYTLKKISAELDEYKEWKKSLPI
jgi:uncharacterized membrane protein YkvA (DUF1232 family)